jgi:hypothetical protein
VVREATFMLEVFHSESPGADIALDEIATEYKNRFRQDAVLRTTSLVNARFYNP